MRRSGIEVLRSRSFADAFRSRYEADLPLTFFNSVVVEELLVGATDRLRRATAEGLYRPFERSRRVSPRHMKFVPLVLEILNS